MDIIERMKLEDSLEKTAYDMFMDRFVANGEAKKYGFSVSRNVRKEGVDLDLAILYKRKYLIGFIDIKSDVKRFKSRISLQFLLLQSVAEKTGAYFVIYTDTKEFLCWTADSKETTTLHSIDDVYKHIVVDRVKLGKTKLKRISSLMYETFKEDELLNSLILDVNITDAKEMVAHIEYDAFIGQVMLKESLENKFFAAMLPELDKGTHIFRYISFAYFLDMLKENKFSLNSIVSMNDKTEIDYIEKYMQGSRVNDLIFNESQVHNANSRFISCFSRRGDDLTLWRLYTNNASGVCLEYSVKNEPLLTDSYIKEVKYAVNTTETQDIDEHKHLDVFRNIGIILKEELKTNFKIRSIYIWKQFFKPSAFSDESEIRLLIFNKNNSFPKKWRVDNSSGIVTSFIEFKLFDTALPICLERVILGPKVPESEINRVQIEELINTLKTEKIMDPQTGLKKDLYNDNERKLLEKVKVERSKIQYYR